MPLRLSVENIMSDSKFLLDENIPKSVRKLLRSEGFKAEYTPKGISNGRLASLAIKEESVIVSRDSDFLNTSLFPPKEYPGIIVFVIHPPKAEKLTSSLSSLLSEVSEFRGKLFTVEEDGFEVSEG